MNKQNQKKKILEYMKEHKTITQREAISIGCYRLSARIYDLRDDGVPIGCEMVRVENADGTHTYIGKYWLEEK